MSDIFESVRGEIPGPRSRALAAALRRTEPRGVTFVSSDVPVFWASAEGATVTDVDGNRYLDLTSAFGVALTGHANPAVAAAIARQAACLPHGMGDVHPSDVKVRLLERLAALAPVDDARIFLSSTGSEAIEFALKTAFLATGKPRVLAFYGSYHGLSYGALEVTGMSKFRDPWSTQLRNSTRFVPFPDDPNCPFFGVAETLQEYPDIGAVIVEPIQGRAGVIVPPDGFLRDLRAACAERGVLLILDEIYTGFGRTGTMFACEREGVRPDILCVGKALGSGFPISAAIASRRVADAWEPSRGEALHTSTYLGNPMGCAAALANIAEIEGRGLVEHARTLEATLARQLSALAAAKPKVVDVRGRGALWAIEFSDGETAGRIAVNALKLGVMVLQSGLGGESLTIAPPLVIGEAQLARALALLGEAVR